MKGKLRVSHVHNNMPEMAKGKPKLRGQEVMVAVAFPQAQVRESLPVICLLDFYAMQGCAGLQMK